MYIHKNRNHQINNNRMEDPWLFQFLIDFITDKNRIDVNKLMFSIAAR